MAHTIDRRSEGKNSNTPQAKASRLRRKKHEANGMCSKCGVEPVSGGKKVCPSCVDKQMISQRKTGFRNHLVEHGIPKDCLDGHADVLNEISKILGNQQVQILLAKDGTYPISDYKDTLDKVVSAFDAVIY